MIANHRAATQGVGAVEDPSRYGTGASPVLSANGGETPERGAYVLDATCRDTEHAPGVRVLGTRRLIHAEEVEVSHETLTVAINDTRPEHDTIVPL